MLYFWEKAQELISRTTDRKAILFGLNDYRLKPVGSVRDRLEVGLF
jgi:hypothetical protein